MSEENKAIATVTASTEKTLGQIQPTTMDEMWWLARAIGNAGIRPAALKTAADVLIVLMTGTELGLSAMQSLRGIHVIGGKPALAADTMGAVVMNDHRCEYLQLTRWTQNECEYETKRRGQTKPVTVNFTMEDAKKAGLLSNSMWSKYPQEMLKARALTKICRAVYPDICMGLYDPEELTTQSSQPQEQQKAIQHDPEPQRHEEPKQAEHQDDGAIDAEFVAADEANTEPEPEPGQTSPRDYSEDPRHHEKTKWLYTLVTECGLTQDDGDRVRAFLKDFRKVESWKHLSPEFIHANCEKLAKMSPKDGDNGEMPERASRILGMISNTPAPPKKTAAGAKLPPQFADLKLLVADAVLEKDANAYFKALAHQNGAASFEELDVLVIQTELYRLEKLSEDFPPHTPAGTPSPRAAAILSTIGTIPKPKTPEPQPDHDPYNGEYDYPDEESYDATYGY